MHEFKKAFPASAPGSMGYDTLVVGAGFAGAVMAERLASQFGQRVLVVDKRRHVGGNAFDRYDDHGLLVHPYGPHIFHTNAAEVFEYLSQFTEWRPYQHRVLASVDGQLLPIPINLDTVNRLYGLSLTSFELEAFFESVAEKLDGAPRTSEDVVVGKVGRELYNKFFRGYTRMLERMLAHPRIHVMTGVDYREMVHLVPWRHLVYTGPIDEFFDQRHGKLAYRSLHFEHVTLHPGGHDPKVLPVGTVNHPNDHGYTRVTEFKHLTGQAHAATSLVYEYPRADGDPYYPVPRPENTALFRRYEAEAEQLSDVTFIGRLASYKYYNMDQAVAQALATARRIGRPAVKP